MSLDSIDVIKAVLPQLTEKQKEEIRLLIGFKDSPCSKSGHKYKKLADIPSTWFKKACHQLFCERCGGVIKVEIN